MVPFNLLDPTLPLSEEDGLHVVYIVAAITGIMRCEVDEEAWSTNADGPVALTLQAKQRGWPVVFVSSEAVERAPQLAYAQQKAYVETVVLTTGGCVVRPNRITAERLDDLVALMIETGAALAGGQHVGLVRWRA